jgi:tetratricopeptide (TPR) repeat protein
MNRFADQKVLFGLLLVAFAAIFLLLSRPSAQELFALGEKHFSSSQPALYDIKRAEYYFERVAKIDPTYPYLYHELARISFLKGQFERALARINLQISLQGEDSPSSYYVRALIEGYMGDYPSAAADYEHFLEAHPNNWAAVNDYAWVLLKLHRFEDAVSVTAHGLSYFPDNPWLLNTHAIARYEAGDPSGALRYIEAAVQAVALVNMGEWLHAYPGNDPAIAAQGLAAFQLSVVENMHMIRLAAHESAVQSP